MIPRNLFREFRNYCERISTVIFHYEICRPLLDQVIVQECRLTSKRCFELAHDVQLRIASHVEFEAFEDVTEFRFVLAQDRQPNRDVIDCAQN